MGNLQNLLTTQEAADFLGVSARTLEGFRVRGGGPRFVKIGGSVRYRLASLEDYLQRQERTSTSDPGQRDSAPRGGRA
jgi:excisionase family DNA binding protein